jgi:hypothetical protein
MLHPYHVCIFSPQRFAAATPVLRAWAEHGNPARSRDLMVEDLHAGRRRQVEVAVRAAAIEQAGVDQSGDRGAGFVSCRL